MTGDDVPGSPVHQLDDDEGGDGGQEVEQSRDPPVGVVRLPDSEPGADTGGHRQKRPGPRHRELGPDQGGRAGEAHQAPALPPHKPHI